MDQMRIVLIVLICVALTAQAVGSMLQYQRIQKQFRLIKKRSEIVAVGRNRDRGRNKTAVLSFDKGGFLQEAHLLAGYTVFAKLKRVHGHDGEHYSTIKAYYENNKRMACITQAIRYIEGE